MKIQLKLKGIQDLKRLEEISKLLRQIKEVETIEYSLSSEYDKI